MNGDGAPPVGRGDFVWTHFPKRENPGVPSDERHIALCLRRFRHRNEGFVLAAVFTTTRPRGERPKAKGEIEIPVERAAEFGQKHAFRIDVRRIAALPLSSEFFPDLEAPGHGITGRSERLAQAADKLLQEIIRETPELVEFLGPAFVRKSIFGR
jgi:hypothetical protein